MHGEPTGLLQDEHVASRGHMGRRVHAHVPRENPWHSEQRGGWSQPVQLVPLFL